MKILLADDHALFREGMRYMLLRLSESLEVLEVKDFHECVRLAGLHPELDMALLDLHMPGSEGPQSVAYFHKCYPHIPVVVVSGEEGRGTMEKVMNSGAAGFICKSTSPQVMQDALNLVLSGGVYYPPEMEQAQPVVTTGKRNSRTNGFGLTPRQMEVLQYLCIGMSNKDIAEKIHLAEGTVKIHVAAVYNVLGVGNRLEAMRMAEQLGLVWIPHG